MVGNETFDASCLNLVRATCVCNCRELIEAAPRDKNGQSVGCARPNDCD